MDYTKDPKRVPFDSLYLDVNNPRLGIEQPPGYEDAKALFDEESQRKMEERIGKQFDIDDVISAVHGQGWIGIDAILVWSPPRHKDKHIVVEGNRRTVALRQFRTKLQKAEASLKQMKANPKKWPAEDVKQQEAETKRLRKIVADTNDLLVHPVAADSVDELQELLPRLLGVRHISGAKPWTPFAESLYVLGIYERLYAAKHPKAAKLAIDEELVEKAADQVSLGETVALRKIRAARAYSHFRRNYQDKLPEREKFTDEEFYSFERITGKPFLRDKFGIVDGALTLSPDGEAALFHWLFALNRPNKADDSNNIFYRQENLLVWDQMKKYDDAHGTAFAARFDISDPKVAPRMREVEAEWRSHMARQTPIDLIQRLLKEFQNMEVQVLLDQSHFIDPLLVEVGELARKYRSMIKAAQSTDRSATEN